MLLIFISFFKSFWTLYVDVGLTEFIQPVKERPRTDTVVARRMVTRALGLRGGLRGDTLKWETTSTE